MKIIVFVFIFLSVFAFGSEKNIKIVNENNRISFYNNGRVFHINKDSNNSIKTLSEEKIQYEEDLPLQLHGFVSNIQYNDNVISLVASEVSSQVKVAVIDTGIDKNNSVLSSYFFANNDEIADTNLDDDNNGYTDDYYGVNIEEKNDNFMDDNGHGTYMSSMIAQNSQGKVKILPIKAFNRNGFSSQFLVAEAIIYAVNRGVDIISCSFGYSYYNDTLRMAVQYALNNDVKIIASSGNNGRETVLYPAGFDGVIAVSSVNDRDRLSFFSNYGNHIDIAVIGENLPVVGVNNIEAKVSGTSISVAYVSGLLGNLKNIKELSIQEIIMNYSKDIVYPVGINMPYYGWDKYTGNGKLQVQDFYSDDCFLSLSNPKNLDVISFLNYPNPIRSIDNSTEIGFFLNKDAMGEIIIYTMSGMEIWKHEEKFLGNQYHKVNYNLVNKYGQILANDSYVIVLRVHDGNKELIKKTIMTVLK
jgi:hypothetical protein